MRVYRYGVLGLGNVGTAFVAHAESRLARLATEYGIEPRLVAAIDTSGAVVDAGGLDAGALDGHKESGGRLSSLPGAVDAPDYSQVSGLGLDCLVECLPTNLESGRPGLDWAQAALSAGIDIVFADKGPLVAALPELEELARKNGCGLGTSGTTAGALPTLSLARRELAGARIHGIAAILNGTTNFILTRMRADGVPFDAALREAQAAGIAEPDPTYDIAGWDTAVKLTIITRGLIDAGASLKSVDRHGIDELDPAMVEEAAAGGGRVRLVGRAIVGEDGSVRLSVAPEVVLPDDPFYLVDGKRKAIKFFTDDLGELVVVGGASGRTDVAASMLKDMVGLATNRR